MPNVRPAWLLTPAQHVKTPPCRRLSTTLIPKPQPTEPSEDGARTLRVRKHNNKSLPLSPILDPKAIEARTKHEQAKATPDRDTESPFQRQLRLNPYAQALITPVRTCVISHARLPEHFLQPFVTRLAEPTSNSQKGAPQLAPSLGKDKILDPTTGTAAVRTTHAISPSRSYVFNNSSLLVAAGKKKKWLAIVSERMKDWVAAKRQVQPDNIKVKDMWTWSAEAPAATLDHKRAEVAELIKEAFLQEKITPLAPSADSPSECFVLRSTPTEDMNPTVSTFDLVALLGDDFGGRFDLLDIERGSIMVVANDKSTLKLRLALLKLSTFLEPCISNSSPKKATPKPRRENDKDETLATGRIDEKQIP